jgi:hypothetical protein
MSDIVFELLPVHSRPMVIRRALFGIYWLPSPL